MRLVGVGLPTCPWIRRRAVLLSAILWAGPASVHAVTVTSVLPNGMTVLVEEDHSAPLVALQLWVRVGWVDEAVERRGLTHFLEHLIFRSSMTGEAREIGALVESRGGRINAWVNEEACYFEIVIPSARWKEGLALLEPAIFASNFDPREVETERGIILEEYWGRRDKPLSALSQAITRRMFPTTRYGTGIEESEAALSGITTGQILSQYAAYFIPNNMTLVVVGDVNRLGVLREARRLTRYAPREVPPRPPLVEPFHHDRLVEETKDVRWPSAAVGWIGPPAWHPDFPAFELLEVLLFEGRSGLVPDRLVTRKRVAFRVTPSFRRHWGSSALIATMSTPPNQVEAAVEECLTTVGKVVREGPTADGMERAKRLASTLDLAAEGTFPGKAVRIGAGALRGEPDAAEEEILERVLTREDIRRVAREYLARERTIVVIQKPVP